jgi:hypothetical protein
LRLALFVPGLLIYFAAKLLSGGHVHSLAGKAVLGAVLLCGFGVAVGASVVRQVFAVELYRSAAPNAMA